MNEYQTQSGIVVPAYTRENKEVDPPLDYPGYRSTEFRHPKNPLVLLPHMLTEVTGPVLGESRLGPLDYDLTKQHEEEPIGQRMSISGRVLDSDGRPVPNTLVEI